MKYIIAYDLGTGGTKASLFDERGVSLASSFIGCKTYYPAENFREQRPREWWDTVVESTKKLMEKTDTNPSAVECLAVSGHSLGAVPIGKDGKLLADQVPIWSDTRAFLEADEFFQSIDEESWYMKTGNGFPAPHYAVFKMMWFKKHHPEWFFKTDKFIGTKDYINYKMTGRLCTDYSYASGSGVYDLLGWKYCEEYIRASKIPEEMFPEIIPSTEIVGTLTFDAAKALGLPDTVKVACGAVDNSCMAAGAGCIGEGGAYTSLGTSAWIAVSSEKPILDKDQRPYAFTHCIPGKYVSATAIFSAGNSFQWLRDQVCPDLLALEQAGGRNAYDAMTLLAETSVPGAHRLIFNPSLAGGSSLDKSVNIRGAFVGLDLSHTRADLIRAALEGICMNLKIALDALEEHVEISREMLFVGGGAKSAFWRGLFADIFDKVVIESNMGQDAGAFGAAMIAAVGSGLWNNFDEAHKVIQIKSSVAPDTERALSYREMVKLFRLVSEAHSSLSDLLAEGWNKLN